MVDTTLGPCHYSEDMSEQATLLAVREDGPGWIPICENHTSDAESDGYTVQEVKDLPDAIEQNDDLPEPGGPEQSESEQGGPDQGEPEAADGSADES